FEPLAKGFVPCSNTRFTKPTEPAADYSQESREAFIRKDLRSIHPVNEIRSAAICFLMLERSADDVQALPMATLEIMAAQYGGYLNKLIPLGRKVALLLLFGLPQSKGKTLDRAAKFALDAVAKIPQAALGISCGAVFAGFTCAGETTEYTAYGETVNLASRLMDKASEGMILTDSTLYLELHSRFKMQALGSLPSRSVGKDVSYYSLGAPAKASPAFQETTFVDRVVEFSRLRELINSSLDTGEPAIIYISGDPGIGKTRLAKEGVAGFLDRIALYLITCEETLQSPLEGIKQIIHQEFNIDSQAYSKSDLPKFRKAWKAFAGNSVSLEQQESVIGSLLNLEWADSFWSSLPSETRNIHLKSAIQSFLKRLCELKQVVLLLDDGQWLDENSRVILQEFSAGDGGQMLIISPCRYLHDGSKVDLQLAGHMRYDLELGALDQKGSHALIQEIVKLKQLPPDTISKIHQRAMGNPLFIEQICYYLIENKLLSSSGLIIGSGPKINTFRINDIIGSRIDRLDESLQNCVFCAGVLGVEFSIAVLSHMQGRDLSSELREGMRLRLFKDAGNQIYAFTHVLIRDVAYQRLMGDKLRELHRQAAEAFCAVYTDKVSAYAEEIAMHFHFAGMLAKAAQYFDLAADDHWETCNFKRSEKNYHRALNLLEQDSGTETPEYSETLFHLGLLYHYLLEHETAEGIYLQVLEFQEAFRGKDDPGLSPYLNNLGRLYKDMGRFAESELLLNRSLQIEINNMPTSSNVADRMNNLGHLYTVQNKHAEALPYYQEAVRLMGANYSFHPYYGGFIKNLATTYLELGQLKEAEPLMAEGLQYTKNAYGERHPATAAHLVSQARLFVLQHKFAAAEKNYLAALSIYNNVFGPANRRTIALMQALGELYLRMGKPKVAKSYRALLEKVKGT
ncbi:MAG: tetratricopeptide repeat protein, partial [Candidatus Cloacimonetes bacterium]|nr:tetratricopeptide repeat protein [Candidatus Cloacimonadota bacterium]